MCTNENMQNRINELIAELSECREDDRNVQNQILQVLSVVGTTLGILFGASYFGSELHQFKIENVKIESICVGKVIDMINRNVTYERIMFLLSLLIVCTGFAYTIVLGISNILRYYYIQTLEERLHELITSEKDDHGRGCFLHWNAYSAPVMTKNVNHITSSYTLLNYISYAVAVMCIVLFSVGLVTSLFLQIGDIKWFDIVVVVVAVCFMMLSIILYIYICANAKGIDQFSWDTAHENHDVRLNKAKGVIYKRSKEFKRISCYLIYPKIQDVQKHLLIILGFICGVHFFNVEWKDYCKNLIFAVIIIDFLLYQARYQLNDIRGLEEDGEVGCKNRLLSDDTDNPEHIIRLSLGVAFVKIIVALLLTIAFGGEVKELLLVSMLILLGVTVAYEFVRKKQQTKWIYFWVGSGYPLRFFVGFFVIMPQNWRILSQPQIICLLLALWSYGTFAAMLSWCNQVSEYMSDYYNREGILPPNYKKKHFKEIQDILEERYRKAEKTSRNKKILPLREKGGIFDPWNVAFLCGLGFLFSIACIEKIPKDFLILEIIIYGMFFVNSLFYNRKKLIFIFSGWAGIVAKVLIMLLSHNLMTWYLMHSIIQSVVTVTYFVLCYQPKWTKWDLRGILHNVLMKIVGEYASKIIDSEFRK